MDHCLDYFLNDHKKRHLYEKLPEQQDDNDNDRVPRHEREVCLSRTTSSFLVSRRHPSLLWMTGLGFILVTVISIMTVSCPFLSFSFFATPTPPPPTHHEKIPTFLSLRNDEDFIYALDNPLYQELQKATLVHDDLVLTAATASSGSIDVKLSTTSTKSNTFQEVTLEWSSSQGTPTARNNHQGFLWGRRQKDNHHNVVQPHDVWVLYCGMASVSENDDALLWQYANVYEVATVAQVQATHAWNCQAMSNEQCQSASSSSSSSYWYMPSFPTWHRQDVCQFVLYQRSTSSVWYARAASPRLDTHYAVTSPTNVHLALTHNPTEMVIQFTTGSRQTGTTPIVAYALASNPTQWIQQRVAGITTTYTATDMCMAPANETGPGKFQSPGGLHTVILRDLPLNTTLVYKAGLQHGQGVTWSDTFSFTTAPGRPLVDEGSTTIDPWSYVVYADQGCPTDGWGQGAAFTAALVEQELNHGMRMVHHFGDLSYAQGAAHQWDAWMQMIEPISRHVPYHIGVGNHEYDYTTGGAGKDPTMTDPHDDNNDDFGNGYHPVWGNFHDDSGGECGVPVSKRFQMPASPGGVFWYAHDFANLHTIVLSSEHDLAPGSVQYQWLEHDLAHNINRTATPWVVVELHRPLYEAEVKWDQNDVGIALRMEVEHMLRDYQVDLVLAGHYHAYLRTCDGLYKGQCDRGGPMHITVGTAGAHLDTEDLYDNPWTATYIKQTYGYGRITVVNATALHFEFVQGAASENDPEAGQVLDDVWVHRSRQ